MGPLFYSQLLAVVFLLDRVRLETPVLFISFDVRTGQIIRCPPPEGTGGYRALLVSNW